MFVGILLQDFMLVPNMSIKDGVTLFFPAAPHRHAVFLVLSSNKNRYEAGDADFHGGCPRKPRGQDAEEERTMRGKKAAVQQAGVDAVADVPTGWDNNNGVGRQSLGNVGHRTNNVWRDGLCRSGLFVLSIWPAVTLGIGL